MTNSYSALIYSNKKNQIDELKIKLENCSELSRNIYTANLLMEVINILSNIEIDILILVISSQTEKVCFSILEGLGKKRYQIIFISDSKEFAFEAIRWKPINYLMMPVRSYVLESEVEKAISEIKELSKFEKNAIKNPQDVIAISSTSKIDLLKVNDIFYIEADGRYSKFHMKNKLNIIASRNLGEYEKLLDSNFFFRIHHRYLVNLRMVNKIDKSGGNYCEVVNGDSIPIAKRRQKELFEYLNL